MVKLSNVELYSKYIRLVILPVHTSVLKLLFSHPFTSASKIVDSAVYECSILYLYLLLPEYDMCICILKSASVQGVAYRIQVKKKA